MDCTTRLRATAVQPSACPSGKIRSVFRTVHGSHHKVLTTTVLPRVCMCLKLLWWFRTVLELSSRNFVYTTVPPRMYYVTCSTVRYGTCLDQQRVREYHDGKGIQSVGVQRRDMLCCCCWCCCLTATWPDTNCTWVTSISLSFSLSQSGTALLLSSPPLPSLPRQPGHSARALHTPTFARPTKASSVLALKALSFPRRIYVS